MLCCTSLGDDGDEIVLSGSTSGHLYKWEGRNCTRCIKAHTGALMAMTRYDGRKLEQGGDPHRRERVFLESTLRTE